MSELNVGQLKGLPVNSNVMTVPSGHTLYAPGHVLQVVSATKTDTFSTSSTSFVDVTGLSVSITPKFASSRIFIIANVASSNANSDGFILLVRDSTAIGNGASGNGQVSSTSPLGNQVNTTGINFLDSPNTTSAITYKIQTRNAGGSATQHINRRAILSDFTLSSHITVMEIAA